MRDIKTKIIATIGPATLDFKVFQAMVNEGIDFIRINTSYGDSEQYDHILRNLKKAKSAKKIHVILDIKNLAALAYARANKLHYIALSFTESPDQIKAVRNALPGCFVISKIETRAGVKHFDKILNASDGIMIARGDLGHAVSLEKVPPLQKDFTYKSLDKEKFVITATEMLLSMINKKKPTRAEVSDVANAVFDGSHAVMLSEETTIGKHPVDAVRMMHKIIVEAEKWKKKATSKDVKIKQELEKHEFRVTIFGSARIKKNDKLYKQTFNLAKEIGKNNIDIITGGGPGLMRAANAGHEAGDKLNKADSIGLVINLPWEPKDNKHLEIKKEFDKFSNRLDHFMALSGAIVMMPGGVGTCLEFFYAWQLIQVKHVRPIPIILLGVMWEDLYKWTKKHLAKTGFISKHDINNLYIAKDNKEALNIIFKQHELFKKEGEKYYKDIGKYKLY